MKNTLLIAVAGFGLVTVLGFGAYALTPSLISFSWNLTLALLPYLIISVTAFVVAVLIYTKSQVLGSIAGIVILIGGIGGYFIVGEHLGEYEFAKTGIEYQVIDELPKTVPDSFRDMPQSIADQILGNNTVDSLFRYSELVHSYKGGKDGYLTQKLPKKIAGKFGKQSFDILEISNNQKLVKVGETPFAIDGAWWDHDLLFVLQKKNPFAWLASSEIRYIVDSENNKWVLYVPTYEYQWNGILRVFTWSGGYFVDGGNISYLSKPQIQSSKYSKLNVAPEGYVKQVTDFYRFKLANSFWGVQFGTDQDYEPSSERADHIMTDKGDLNVEFIEPEGVSTKIKDMVFVGGGKQVLVYKPEEQYTPDIFKSKVEAILAKNPGSIVNQTYGKFPVTAIAGWHVGDFIPVLRNGNVWYVYFINSTADASIRRGLIAVNSSNQAVASGQEIDSFDVNQFAYFNTVEDVEAWIGGKDVLINELNKPTKNSGQNTSVNDFREMQRVQQEILKNQQAIRENQQEILRLLKAKQ